jgi:hypothetical protein
MERFTAFCTFRYKVLVHPARSAMSDVIALQLVTAQNGDPVKQATITDEFMLASITYYADIYSLDLCRTL